MFMLLERLEQYPKEFKIRNVGFKRFAKYLLPAIFYGIVWVWLEIGWIGSAIGQTPLTSQANDLSSIEKRINDHLLAGEFPLASAAIADLPDDLADFYRGKLFQIQQASNAYHGATRTLNGIRDDRIRSQQLADYRQSIGLLSDPSLNSSAGGFPNDELIHDTNRGLALGGITEMDFMPLINLITQTIATDSWSINGGAGNMMAFPAGVYVDTSGTLQRIKKQPRGIAHFGSRIGLGPSARSDLFIDSGNRDAQLFSRHRKVSLTRLERAAQLKSARGEPLDETMLWLAGLTEIEYVICDLERNEILLIGPAAGWQTDINGRVVSRQTNTPVMHLDDLVVCLRNAVYKGGKFGCSINPRQENLAATHQFVSSTSLKGNAWSEKLRETLGLQDIEVFGIDPSTRTARIIVEADYHMKLIAMGIEPTLPDVPNYLDRLNLNEQETGSAIDIARWWFTAKNIQVAADDAREVYQLDRFAIQVLSETELLNRDGQRLHTQQSSNPTAGFAHDFTTHFDRLAELYPIYHELKNVFALSLVSNLIHQEGLHHRCGWNLTFFGNHDRIPMAYRPDRLPVAETVQTIMNQRLIKTRRDRSTIHQRIVGVSGGVEFDVIAYLDKIDYDLLDASPVVEQAMLTSPSIEDPQWWWD